MKRFIFKTSILILSLLIFPILIKLIDGYVFQKNNKQSYVNVIIGDSHTQTGINDSLDIQLNNISQSSETYYFSYHKLKKILKKNKPEKVVLGLSPHNLTFFQDEKTYALNGEKLYKNLYSRYFLSLDWEGVKHLYKNSNANIYSLLNSISKTNIEALLNGKNAYIGQYRKSNKSNLDATLINNKIKIHFYDNKDYIYKESKVQIEYLEKINSLCFKNDITLYIINLPVHKDYRSQIPSEIVDNYDKVINQIRSKGVKILDYSFIDLPNEYFGDGDHLNSLGADVITKILIKDLDL